MWPLTEVDQRYLLRLARRSLEEHIAFRSLPRMEPPLPLLAVPRGAFVTLRKAGVLRGCIGRVEAVTPLAATIQECALSAALSDPRFDPVSAEEVPYLQIEISVLSPLSETRPEEIEVGRHGLLISQGSRRALLLPQVAVEWGWDRIRFLQETCLKGNLAPNAWKDGARIQTFTAQVFGERDFSEQTLTAAPKATHP